MQKQPNSNDCFICGVKNVAGAQVAFYETTEEDGIPAVQARFRGRDVHQGYPGRMHGGVSCGILDEVMARCVTMGDAALDPPVWGVTVDLSMRYHAPVPLDVELMAQGRIIRERSRMFEATAELTLPDGTVAVSAVGKYMKLPLDDIAGIDPAELGWQVYPDDFTAK